MEDRLTDIIIGKKVDCCGKCRYFEKSDDPLDHTKSFGHCKYLKSKDEDDELGIFNHEYCENFSPLNPYDKDTKFYIALFKDEDKSYHYFKEIEPSDFEKADWSKRENDINLLFNISDLNLYCIQNTTYYIDNKLPNCIHGCSYIISTEDNEQELKDRLVKYILHRLEENIKQYEDWLKETRNDYTFYSKFLKERNF